MIKSQAAAIQTSLKSNRINIKLNFIEIVDDSEWGTADSLRNIGDKLTVNHY